MTTELDIEFENSPQELDIEFENVTKVVIEPPIKSISVNGDTLPIDKNKNVDIPVPTKTSELENDGDGTSPFATKQEIAPIEETANNAFDLAKEKQKAISYDSYQTFINAFNGLANDTYQNG